MLKIADLFCGAGGETTGILQAAEEIGSRYDLAAINHWEIAIETHKANHPRTRHYCTNLNHLNPHDIFSSRDRLDLLWASPECTFHSIARGGRPCSNQSRASAWLILKWLSELYVRRVILENVPEFINWGPLGANGKPLQSRKGNTFRAFITALQSLGYRVEWRFLRAADYGDPTTRKRFFLQAVRGKGRIIWPEPTHAEEPGLFQYKPWIPARQIIDWSIHGKSINRRKRPLAEATIRRIETGIRRYWGQWAEPFLVILRGTSTTRAIDQPLPTVTSGGGHFGLVEPLVMTIDHRGSENNCSKPSTQPLQTITTKNRFAVVEPFLVQSEHGGRIRSINVLLNTITCSSRGFGIVEPFVLHQCTPGRPRTVNEPIPTVTSKNGHGLVEPFLVKYYGTSETQPIRIPLGALTTHDRYALIRGDLRDLDITFRMLQPHELSAAQGFPRDYWFAGNKSEQVRQIGNAVPVGTSRALALSALSA